MPRFSQDKDLFVHRELGDTILQDHVAANTSKNNSQNYKIKLFKSIELNRIELGLEKLNFVLKINIPSASFELAITLEQVYAWKNVQQHRCKRNASFALTSLMQITLLILMHTNFSARQYIRRHQEQYHYSSTRKGRV